MKEQRKILKTSIVLITTLLFLMVFAAWSLADDTLKSEEQKMLDFINQERITRDLRPLVMDPSLTVAARDHSQEMIALNYFSHESPVIGDLEARIKNSGIKNWAIVGENLAGAQDVKIAHDALMKSEKHKENILNSNYVYVGVGIADGSRYGKMFTQIFAKYKTGNQDPVNSNKAVSVNLDNKENINSIDLTKKKVKVKALIKKRLKRF